MDYPVRVKPSGGFSLAEVVVALTLFTLAAFVLGRAVVDNLQTLYSQHGFDEGYVLEVVRQEILTTATRSVLEAGGEMEVVKPVQDRNEANGEAEDHETVRVRWEAEIFPTRILDVHAVDAEVRLQGADDLAVYPFRLFVYRPAWSELETQQALEENKEQEFRERSQARGGLIEDPE